MCSITARHGQPDVNPGQRMRPMLELQVQQCNRRLPFAQKISQFLEQQLTCRLELLRRFDFMIRDLPAIEPLRAAKPAARLGAPTESTIQLIQPACPHPARKSCTRQAYQIANSSHPHAEEQLDHFLWPAQSPDANGGKMPGELAGFLDDHCTQGCCTVLKRFVAGSRQPQRTSWCGSQSQASRHALLSQAHAHTLYQRWRATEQFQASFHFQQQLIRWLETHQGCELSLTPGRELYESCTFTCLVARQ